MLNSYDGYRADILMEPMKAATGTIVKIYGWQEPLFLKAFLRALWILVLKYIAGFQTKKLITC
jgi:hypothetical protein